MEKKCLEEENKLTESEAITTSDEQTNLQNTFNLISKETTEETLTTFDYSFKQIIKENDNNTEQTEEKESAKVTNLSSFEQNYNVLPDKSKSLETTSSIETPVENATLLNTETPNVYEASKNVTLSNTETFNEIEVIDLEENVINEISEKSNISIDYNFSQIPFQITGSWKEFFSKKHNFLRNNFTRGCKWAPDGSCILTCSDDNILRIFNLPEQLWDISQWNDIAEMEAAVKISEGELIYDYCWYPLMTSADYSTCCLASASKNSTVHLWDGFSGELRCSYRTYNHMDEIVTPHSLSFDTDGQKLFCGFEKVIRIFNVDTPGRNFEERRVFDKKSGQSGIISCFAFTSSNRNISAVGSYQKTIGIYSEPSGDLECLLEGQKGGVTQLIFSPDSTLLYSGGRKDPEILCWDLRNLGTVLFTMRRSCLTNQRMYFDISRCGKYVISGNYNGVISVWDTTKEPKSITLDELDVLEPILYYLAHDDCVNGISLHPSYPLLCSSSGQRKFPSLLSEDDDEIFSKEIDKFDNSLRLWWIGN